MNLTDLILELDSLGLAVVPRGVDGLGVRGSLLRLTPDLQEQIRLHKLELRQLLDSPPDGADALWLAICDQLAGRPEFPGELLAAMRRATATWSQPTEALACPRCGGSTIDVRLNHPPHRGRTMRRDCRECGRFLEFHIWYGKDV